MAVFQSTPSVGFPLDLIILPFPPSCFVFPLPLDFSWLRVEERHLRPRSVSPMSFQSFVKFNFIRPFHPVPILRFFFTALPLRSFPLSNTPLNHSFSDGFFSRHPSFGDVFLASKPVLSFPFQ